MRILLIRITTKSSARLISKFDSPHSAIIRQTEGEPFASIIAAQKKISLQKKMIVFIENFRLTGWRMKINRFQEFDGAFKTVF
jgi:hypothetical protein